MDNGIVEISNKDKDENEFWDGKVEGEDDDDDDDGENVQLVTADVG